MIATDLSTVFISDYLHISFFVFLAGLWGLIVLRTNLISILIAIELLLFSCNFNFILFSFYLDDLLGQVFALLILTVAAAEAAIGLALLVVYYRVRGTINSDYVSSLKG